MGGAHELDVLDGTNITAAQMRSACLVLAGQALAVSRSPASARDKLRPALEAIGAISCDPQPRTPWGNPVKTRKGEAGECC